MIERHCSMVLTPTMSKNRRSESPEGIYERRLPADTAVSTKISEVSLYLSRRRRLLRPYLANPSCMTAVVKRGAYELL